MAGRASGFCIYNDVALGVARRSRRRSSRPLRGRRRPSRRRRAGALLGRPEGHDRLDPRDRRGALPRHRRGRRDRRAARRARDGDERPTRTVLRRPELARAPSNRSCPRSPTRSGPPSWSRSTAATPTSSTRSPTSRSRPLPTIARRDCSTASHTSTAMVAGSRPAAAVTTRTGSCRVRGRWSGWRPRTVTCRRDPRRVARPLGGRERGRCDQAPPPRLRISTSLRARPPEPDGIGAINRRATERALSTSLELLQGDVKA